VIPGTGNAAQYQAFANMRLKYLWYAVVVLAFFGIVYLPKDWVSVIELLTPAEVWWTIHIPHPIIAAFIIGLFFSTVMLPEIWSYAKPRWFPPKPRPDISAAIAYKTILEGSKLAKELTSNWESLPG
jgi:hypothetical protein